MDKKIQTTAQSSAEEDHTECEFEGMCVCGRNAGSQKLRLQTRAVIRNFKKNVINRDQTGCQYQSTYNRTLAERNSKTMFVRRRDMNKVTHSYTAQYVITLCGELLSHMFLCLREATGNFGPKVLNTVDKLMKVLLNVIVMSSKSGKLTTQLYCSFLSSVMLPHTKKEKFLLIIDSWGDQTNPGLYDEIFTDDEGLGTCIVKVVPPKCTPIYHPCDVYFYRQFKHLIKRLHNCSYLIEREREITTHEEAIKIHSILHEQLSAPIFKEMLCYAWFAFKLSDEREVFKNVSEVCFSMENLKRPCICGNIAFIQCSWCRLTLFSMFTKNTILQLVYVMLKAMISCTFFESCLWQSKLAGNM
ncbi:uncharacterized protein LOC126266625 isoform X1 [Schistocerca gregaria]|uniref:uncharacterized protein LOC126266625 isoform X1 n=1 Tax=Schistocerca gregaria TaxID=7010 RepID=UPI00211EFB8D|nr:uncharacterized protein LOC126266625 isoform X1 [Schistocerca gregaria]XP_049826934.1 uncharacterized protein LOC126266625 isoform X1 [Schistocerca gregaria]XP_049826935.1 uncharacterized protein LOC126266625 isoform X1 [Schistocerca gregaria]XP_049826936.1 uncharacterized protein LOC126266625 isoform X1 [Schistocerca gregaria]XP_049826938.1 uncharacterized protein LOC126266625 isoform X1 [Schistocerca gregaria]XP_049826939.1 uncharacterized protein LOC126266625 isoform X1 [Schistocerca gre